MGQSLASNPIIVFWTIHVVGKANNLKTLGICALEIMLQREAM